MGMIIGLLKTGNIQRVYMTISYRAMAGNCPCFPKLAFKKPGKIIYEKITSSSVN